MIISAALVLLATLSGTLATYLYDDSPFAARLCAGSCIGIAALGLIGFVVASLVGLNPLCVLLTAGLLSVALLLLVDKRRRKAWKIDVASASRSARQFLTQPDRMTLGYVLFYGATILVLWRVFSRAVIDVPEGIFTGLLNNFGDLPFHLSVITSFAFGNNFPPQDPTYAGVQFTYPFLTDFVSAIFVTCGASLRDSMFIENIVVAVSFVGLLHHWASVILRDRLAAVLTPVLVLLNGGLGWVLLFQRAYESEQGLFGVLKNLPPSFTVIPDTTWRWGNAISALLVPQRGILLGLPLAVIVFTQWWRSRDRAVDDEGTREQDRQRKNRQKQKKKTEISNISALERGSLFPLSGSARRMVAAACVAGLLPLVHAHSFVVVMGVGACLALIEMRWRDWFLFFLVASVIALPQMWWSTHNSAVDAKKFFEWQYGWDRGKDNAVWFWFKNSGLFIPVVILAILWRGKQYLISKRLLFFYLPFTLCFIVPNVLKMAPWIWDNIKVLFYWWLASAPLVALFLARLWQQGRAQKVVAGALFVCLTLAGLLDVAGIALRSNRYEVFDARGVRFAEVIKQQTEPQALIVHAPVHNTPVFLTGRHSLMGYPGHIWTHGLEFAERESEIRRIYAGAPDAKALLDKYGIEYAVIGPQERNMSVNEPFFAQFMKVGEVGEYRLVKIKP